MPASETGSDYDYNDSPEHSRPGTGNNNNNNNNTGQKKKTIKKRKVKVPLSIEEVFNKPSTMTASNINPPPARVVLTPRSAEACLKLGVNPEVIKIRDIDSFWEPDIDPSVQRMRHEAYVQRRYEVMKQLRTERKKLMNSEFHQDRSSPGIIGLSPEQILKQQQEQSITMLELEKKRLEKMKERQERELEQMLQYEINRTKLQQDMEKRIQESKKKEELRKKQQEKRMKLMVEERKLRELQKLSMEEAEEAQRREMAKIMYEREQKILQDMKDKEAEEKEKLKQLEYERKMKQEQHREQVQKYFVEEQMKLRSRLEALNEAEERKQQKLLKQQEEKKIQLKIKRDMVEQRISKNMEMAAMVEKKRKDDFLTKQEKTELLRQQHLQDQENQRILHQQELEIQEQRRKIILLQQRREEEQKKEEMLQQFEENNRHVEEIRALQEHEQHLIKEKKNLILQMKAENVERVKRMSEYKRLNILKKIEQNDDRTNQLLDARQQLIKQRRETSIKTKKQKDDLNRLMEEVRTDASKANKIINMALKGNVSLKSIMSSTAERSSTGSIKNKSNSRSRSPNNKNKRGVTHSAGDIPTGMNSNSDSMKFELQESHHTNPLPYISPYELNSGQSNNNNNNNKKSQKITL